MKFSAAILMLPLVAAGAYYGPAQQTGDFKISTNVDRVVLPVTVTDKKGEFVAGLDKEHFKVFEDWQPQDIRIFSSRDVPVTVGLVVDGSGSMRSKRREAILAALNFVRLSNPRDEIFVVNFNEKVSLGLPDGTEFSSDPDRLVQALNMQPATGKTALYDAVLAAVEHLGRGTRDKKALVVVSDGGDNASGHTLENMLALAQKAGAIIYTIGVFDRDDPDRNPGVLKTLARLTGGEAFLPEKLSQLPAVCAHIARDLRRQYTIGYEPSNPTHDGTYRKIEVVAGGPGYGKLRARTRPGYYAPRETEAKGRIPQ